MNWFNQVDATYRGDLRDLNELNFSRFDAKLEQRLAQSDAKWEQRLAQSDARWEQRLAQFDGKWEQRLAQFDTKWEQRLARLEVKLEAEGRMLLKWMVGLWMATVTTLGSLILALQHFGRP